MKNLKKVLFIILVQAKSKIVVGMVKKLVRKCQIVFGEKHHKILFG